MAHTYDAVYEHAVFSSKSHRPFLDKSNTSIVFSFLAGALRNMDCHCLIVGGHEDHVHMLYRKPPTLRTKDMIEELKRQSSLWLRDHNFVERNFHWQSGFGAFSISNSEVDSLSSYIGNQTDHHREATWEQEYRDLLEKHGVDYSEQFLD